ncbi:hypothetical protein CQW23_09967 [Capsicum baccatum]|uniref:DUF676 domain-containing protein n=1 Tax=Capsicum baccatum TaxID=33114 RepID=A0A2G2WYE4_CAPBA|nr:hypothetical protein CQW23_09967 [Capsicum baccatum]
MDMEDKPEHLPVLVHGILASPSDWTFAQAELKKQLGRNFVIYASSCNTFTKTFTGIDEAGKRLANEVMLVVKKRDHTLKDFLFSSFSCFLEQEGINCWAATNQFDHLGNTTSRCQREKTASISIRTSILEKLAAPIAPFLAGHTGSQLFLTDGKPNKPPLLLRMASDFDDGKFLSALGAFKCRVLYANVSYDHMVGWRTSSIRRETELFKPPRRSLDGYKHVVDMEYCPGVPSEGPHLPPKAAKAKEAARNAPCMQTTLEYHEIMEEEMMRGLQQFSWKKVDASFHSAFWPFFAHNNIHVKSE